MWVRIQIHRHSFVFYCSIVLCQSSLCHASCWDGNFFASLWLPVSSDYRVHYIKPKAKVLISFPEIVSYDYYLEILFPSLSCDEVTRDLPTLGEYGNCPNTQELCLLPKSGSLTYTVKRLVEDLGFYYLTISYSLLQFACVKIYFNCCYLRWTKLGFVPVPSMHTGTPQLTMFLHFRKTVKLGIPRSWFI